MSLLGLLIPSLPGVSAIKRIFPHVDEIADPPAAQSLKLAWERIHSLEERLQRAEASLLVLQTAHNTSVAAITAAATAADAALALSQRPGEVPTSTVGGGPGGGGGPAPGEPGSQTNPIIAMSIVPADIAASVRASLQVYGIGPGTADQYWIDHASVVAQFSNGKWYQGWNAYWEARANPSPPFTSRRDSDRRSV